MRAKIILIVLVSIISAAGLVTPSQAAALHVPSEYASIQPAVDAASDGDEVVVAEGTYYENINFKGKAITVRSTDPDDPEVVAATVMDGGGEGNVVTFESHETATAVLTGLTITNAGTGAQAGIACYDQSSPTITKNLIRDNPNYGIYAQDHCSPDISNNTITDNGRGIYSNSGCTLTITNNTIVHNSQYGIYSQNCSLNIANNVVSGSYRSLGRGNEGSGICVGCESNCSLTITNNTIEDNVRDGIHCGNGAYPGAPSDCSPTISGNIIRNNSGYGINCRGGSPITSNNVITHNTAGINCNGCTPTITNNTISDNGSHGIDCRGSQMTVLNSIIAFCGGAGINKWGLPEYTNVTVSHCNVYGNIGGNYTGMSDPTGTAGNISEDPLFASVYDRDYHLKSQYGRWDPSAQAWVTDTTTSLSIDVGDPTSDYSNEPQPNGGRINMGAYGNTAYASKSPGACWITISAGPAGDPNPVGSGGQVQCSVEAEDSRGHHLSYQWTAEGDAGSFDDPTQQNPTWTAPENTPDSIAEYEISVTVTCSQGQQATASYTQQVLARRPYEHTFSAGQKMIGIPVEVAGSPTMEELTAADDVVWWDPQQYGYLTIGEPTPYVLGRGYWAQFAEPTNVEIAGNAVTGEFTYDVQDGWNIVSIPYNSEIGLEPITTAPTLRPFAWTDQGHGYELVAPLDGDLAPIHNTLQPWWGYWVLSDGEGTIAWNPTSPSAQSVELLQIGKADAKQSGWQIQLTAQAGSRIDAFNFCGVANEQTAQALSIANPPPASGSVNLYFPSQVEPMATSIRPTTKGKLVWDFEVRTDLRDTEVTIGYPDLTVVPNSYRLTLIDLDADKSTYMRTTRGYAYNSGPQGGVRHFRITAAPKSETSLLVTGVTAQQVSGQQAAITYSLSAAAEVDIQLRNIAGRLIRRLHSDKLEPAGTHSVAWNLTNEAGGQVPAGNYLYIITARTDNGQQVSALRPLSIAR